MIQLTRISKRQKADFGTCISYGRICLTCEDILMAQRGSANYNNSNKNEKESNGSSNKTELDQLLAFLSLEIESEAQREVVRRATLKTEKV